MIINWHADYIEAFQGKLKNKRVLGTPSIH